MQNAMAMMETQGRQEEFVTSAATSIVMSTRKTSSRAGTPTPEAGIIRCMDKSH